MTKKYFWRVEPKNLIFRSEILTYPVILKIIKEIAAEIKITKILDAGCGTGKLARMLSSFGFQVYGIDKSEDAINLAKKQDNKIIYNIGDVSKLSDYYKKDSFDIIISAFTTLYLDRIKLNKFFKEASIVLKRNGYFIIADVHPFLPITQPKTKWEKWHSKNIDYFKTNKIKQTIFLPKDNNGIKREPFNVKWVHHQFFSYLNKLVDVGFKLERVYELKPNRFILNQYKKMWGEETKIPVYFILQMKK